MARIPLQMKDVRLNIPILSVGTISQPEVMKQAGSAVEGVVYTTCAFNTLAPDTPALREFVDKFTAKYKAPPIFFEVFGYDTFNLLWLAARRSGLGPDDVNRGLLSIQDVPMAAGNVSVRPNREVSFPVVLKQIKNGQWAHLEQ
jgi:branched-chain amino acid transport system substrate-binding protein